MSSLLKKRGWFIATTVAILLVILSFSTIRIHYDHSFADSKKIPDLYYQVVKSFFESVKGPQSAPYLALFTPGMNPTQAETTRLQIKAFLGATEVAEIYPYAYEEVFREGKNWILVGFNVLLADQRRISGQFTFLADETPEKIQLMNIQNQWFSAEGLKTSFRYMTVQPYLAALPVLASFLLILAAVALLFQQRPRYYLLWLLPILTLGYGSCLAQISSGTMSYFYSFITISLPLISRTPAGEFIFSFPLGAAFYLLLHRYLKRSLGTGLRLP